MYTSDLNVSTTRRLNGINITMLQCWRITDHSIPTESHSLSTSYNLVHNIYSHTQMPVTWCDPSFGRRHTCLHLQLLIPFHTFDEITDLTSDKTGWNYQISGIPRFIVISLPKKKPGIICYSFTLLFMCLFIYSCIHLI